MKAVDLYFHFPFSAVTISSYHLYQSSRAMLLVSIVFIDSVSNKFSAFQLFSVLNWLAEERVNGASYRHSWVYAEDVWRIRIISLNKLLGPVTITKEPFLKCYNTFLPTSPDNRCCF